MGDLHNAFRSEGALIQHVRLKHPGMTEEVKAKLEK